MHLSLNSSLLIISAALNSIVSASEPNLPNALNCYIPNDNGWAISIRPGQAPAQDTIGAVKDNPRSHRRPLFPPCDRKLLMDDQEYARHERTPFRPIFLAYIEPRFILDLHSEGGLMGHLLIGLALEDGTSKWFDKWSDIDLQYSQGQMLYQLRDPQFPGVTVTLAANPLADAVGGIVKINVEGLTRKASLIWVYGGANGYTTGYDFTSPSYTFASNQCADNTLAVSGSIFTLSRKNSSVTGSSSWASPFRPGDPNQVLVSPSALVQKSIPADTNSAVVAFQVIDISDNSAQGFIVVGIGNNIRNCIADPPSAFAAALDRNKAIANHVVTATPDKHFDNAVTMMAYPLEGIWGDAAILHGAWSWRNCYLGWRGWYGPLAYGWPERVKHSILQHAKLGVIGDGPDRGSVACMLESRTAGIYNMDEVFLDHVRRYFEYTNDVNTMRQVYPVLKGVIEWENRRLLPNNEALYENSLNTFVSDAHWYLRGHCTQASAYMFAANTFMADLSKRLGENGEPYSIQANRIKQAMQSKLWLASDGVFAEYIDTRANKLLHPEPELPTIYHSIEFGIADQLQACQMLHWTDIHLRQEKTPGQGRAYWSSNWAPNRGNSYTHTTNDLLFQEQLNLAIVNCMLGRADDAYAITRSVMCGIYNGLTPGGLSAHMYTDGRQRGNDEFADSISLWGRLVCEGIFGIMPNCPDQVINLSPCLPSGWDKASIKTSRFSYSLEKQDEYVKIEFTAPSPVAVHLKYPLKADVRSVTVNGKKIDFNLEPGMGFAWVNAAAPVLTKGVIKINCKKLDFPALATIKTTASSPVQIELPFKIAQVLDPQKIFSELKVSGNKITGHLTSRPVEGLIFIKPAKPDFVFLPQPVSVQPARLVQKKIWQAPKFKDHNLAVWHVIDLTKYFNSPLTGVLDQIGKNAFPIPEPACQMGFIYWKSYITQAYHGGDTEKPSDAAWRIKVGPDNIAWTTDGIPFKTVKDGNNIAAVTLAGVFPAKLQFPVNASGKKLYLMISGVTFPVQSHVVNLRLKLNYNDGTSVTRDLVNPFDIGDCWGTWCGRYHDTPANGFENIGGRRGPAGSSQVQNATCPVEVGDTHAHLLDLEIKPEVLSTVEIEAIANDVVFGVMGATIMK